MEPGVEQVQAVQIGLAILPLFWVKVGPMCGPWEP